MAVKKSKQPLVTKTDKLVNKLLDLAIKSRSGPGEVEEGEDGAPAMDLDSMRKIVETSVKWQAIKAKIIDDDEDTETSAYEEMLNELHSGTGVGGTHRRRKAASAPTAEPITVAPAGGAVPHRVNGSAAGGAEHAGLDDGI